MKEWFTLREIAEAKLPDMPETERGIQALAEQTGWDSHPTLLRPRVGRGGGREYHRDLLPLSRTPVLSLPRSKDGYGDPAPYGSSVALDGTGYIRSTGNPAAFGTGNFTVRMRAAIDAAPVTDTALVRVSNTGELSLRWDTAGGPKLELAATGVGVFASASFSPTIGTVYDIEVTRVSGVSYIFINGVLTVSAACAHSFVAGDLDIGLNGSVRLYAHMTDILLYSVGLHSSSFTPTTLPPC